MPSNQFSTTKAYVFTCYSHVLDVFTRLLATGIIILINYLCRSALFSLLLGKTKRSENLTFCNYFENWTNPFHGEGLKVICGTLKVAFS